MKTSETAMKKCESCMLLDVERRRCAASLMNFKPWVDDDDKNEIT